MTPSINAPGSSAPAGATQPSAAPPAAPVTENMFLKLLVAQLQHQDPLNPTDSTQFVTQLAQFQQMEQSMNMSQDLTAIRQDMDQLVNPKSSTTAPTA